MMDPAVDFRHARVKTGISEPLAQIQSRNELGTRSGIEGVFMTRHAFKEWAVICRALELGRQAVILRKGGIAEEGGAFKPDHSRFWLYPTFAHQQRDGIKVEALPLLDLTIADRAATGKIFVSSYAEVSGAFHVRHLEDALAIDKFHFWSEETVRQRFLYREPGLFVLVVRIYRVPTPFELPYKPEHDGCKTWVEFEREPSADGAVPAIDSRTYAGLLEGLDQLLNPTALA
jgi:hypothetical protein